jgi:hypothetical protein
MGVIDRYFNGDHDDKPHKDKDPHSWTQEELQVLSPRRKILVDMERALSEAAGEEVRIPATRKMHKGRDWKSSSPNISNDDLYEIAKGVFKALDDSPMVAQTIRPDVLDLTPGEARIYSVLDSEDRYFSMSEIADEVELDQSTVRDYIYRMRSKMDFQEKNVGLDGSSYQKKLKLPPAYRNMEDV